MSRWLIASGDFTTHGGMDRANHAQARYLADRGDEVHLVAHHVAEDLASRPNVRVHHAPRPLHAHLAGAPLLSREVRRQSRALGPSTRVLVNGGNAPGPATWVHYVHAAHEPRVEASVRSRLSASIGRRYYLARECAVIGAATLVICNSERTAADVRRHYGVSSAKLRVIYYGVDRGVFGGVTADERRTARAALGIRAGRRAALFVGALGDRRKGFDRLFDAWRMLASDPDWDVDLLVAGTGAEQAAWQARIREAGLGSAIRFLGFRADVAAVIAGADVLVHPARYEAYGLGVHEAICRGIPAIVTAAAGVAERYPESARDLLVPEPGDAAHLVATLRRWRSDADAWPAWIAPFAASLGSRSWDTMAAEIAALVEAVPA